jgi:hypothetical protein
MIVACPSCETPFEADDALAAGPGLPLCDDCSSAVRAPPKPPLLEAPPPAENPGERLSLGEIAPSSTGGPTLLDGGFDPFTSDGEPVSLRDLGVVLAPMASPPAWSGLPRSPAAASTTAMPAPAKPTFPATHAKSPAKKEPAATDPTPPAEPAKPEPVKATEPAKAEPVKAEPVKKVKPTFFQVDALPPPSVDVPVDFEEPPRSSGHEDLRFLMTTVADRSKKRPDADLVSLRGALFVEPPRLAPPPPDLALLLPLPEESPAPLPNAATQAPALLVTMGDPRPRETASPALETAVRPAAARPPVVARSAAPETRRPPAARPSFKSGVPVPVVSERRPAVAAAARRSGIASWAVAVASVSAVAIVVLLRFGSPSSSEPSGSESSRAAPPVPSAAPVSAPPAPRPTAEAPEVPSAAPVPTAGVAAHTPGETTPVQRSAPATVEPIRPVVERSGERPAVVAPPPPPTPRPTAPPAADPDAVFDRGAARTALAAAASAAKSCKQADDPSGVAKVSITFSTSGRVASARVTGAPFQGTRAGACIASAFRTAQVPPFGGDPVAVGKDVVIP